MYRVSIGFQDSALPSFPFQGSGILAVVTDGSPDTPVAQAFHLHNSDVATNIYYRASVSSGIASVAPRLGGTIYFIGTPE